MYMHPQLTYEGGWTSCKSRGGRPRKVVEVVGDADALRLAFAGEGGSGGNRDGGVWKRGRGGGRREVR